MDPPSHQNQDFKKEVKPDLSQLNLDIKVFEKHMLRPVSTRVKNTLPTKKSKFKYFVRYPGDVFDQTDTLCCLFA